MLSHPTVPELKLVLQNQTSILNARLSMTYPDRQSQVLSFSTPTSLIMQAQTKCQRSLRGHPPVVAIVLERIRTDLVTFLTMEDNQENADGLLYA